MNKIFKKIWNQRRGCFVAVSEVTNSASQESSKGTVRGCSYLSACKGYKQATKFFRLAAVTVCLMPILGTAATLSNLAVVDVKDNKVTNSNGVVAVQLSATLQLEKGSAVTESLGSTNQASITLGGEKSSNTKIHSGQYDRYYDYFVNHHGGSFTFHDSDRDYWSATDQQLTATHYAGGLVSSYTTIYRSWSRDDKLSTTGGFRTPDLYNDPKLFNKIQTSSLGTGEVSYVINNGTVVKTNTLNIKPTKNTLNVDYGVLLDQAQWAKVYSDWTLSTLNILVGSNVQATSGDQATHLINNGGVLDVGTLDVCPGCSYTQNSGSTNIDDIKGGGDVTINGGEIITNGLLTLNPAKAANIAAKDLNSLTNLTAISYAAGTKASLGSFTSMADQIHLGSATIKIGGDYTQSIRDQASSAIKNKYGSGVTVQFTGNLASDNSLDLSNGWTSAVLNSVFDENYRANYLFHTLNWNGEGQDKVIGTGDISKNFGVKNVENVGSITVNNGAIFAILGEKDNTRLAGSNFTADQGTLVFGAKGLASGGTAAVVKVLNGGALKVEAGDFTINDLELDGNLHNSGTLRLSEFQFGSEGLLSSSGTLQADRKKLFSIEDSHIDGLNVVGLGSAQPQEVREQLTEFFRKYVPENQKVLDEIVSHAQFRGGKVIVTNAHLTETQRDDLTKAFKDKFFLFSPNVSTCAVEGRC